MPVIHLNRRQQPATSPQQFKAEALAMAREHLSRTGAPALQEQTAMAAHQAAENALSMALHYLRSSASNVPGATRKAVQALAALNDLQGLAPAGAARRQIGGAA